MKLTLMNTLHASKLQPSTTMNTHLSFILLFSSLLVCFSSAPSPCLAATASRCNPNDYKALMNIKSSLKNPYHLASWEPNTDCCEWYCLQCDRVTNRVSELTIFSGNITGQIPYSVGDLPFLTLLVFRKLTDITGSIPSSILKLKNLQMLQLDSNKLSGRIPDFLGQMSSSLTFLDLSFNQFSGLIPPSLSNLHLRTLHLDRNKLTGSIPVSFGKFSSPLSLYLSHNLLSGPIPKSLGYLDFSTLDLSRNKLQGDASVLFNPKHQATDSIDLSRNLLEFDLTYVRFPVSLKYLDLSHNKIRGMIPEQMKNMDLYGLNVSYNGLCGKIPFGGKMQSFDYSSYFHNQCLCGSPLASCL